MTNDAKEGNAPAKKNSAGGFEKYIIALVVLCFAAGLAYQVFFCSTCYGITQKFVPPAAKTNHE